MVEVSFPDVRREWEELQELHLNPTAQVLERFLLEQPVIAAFLMAVTEDLDDDAVELVMRVALATDRLYERTLGFRPRRVNEDAMECADSVVERNASELVGMETESAMRTMLAKKEFAVPAIAEGLITLMIAEDDDPESEAGMAGFLVAKSVALAYEYANDIQTMPAFERRTSEDWDDADGDDDEAAAMWLEALGKLDEFLESIATDPSAAELALAWKETQEGIGVDLPASDAGLLLAMSFLLDMRMPDGGETVAERFLRQHGGDLDETQRRTIEELSVSHLGLYDVLGRSTDGLQTQFRDLATGEVMRVTTADIDQAGDVAILRLVGPPNDARLAGPSLAMFQESREVLVELLERLRAEFQVPASNETHAQRQFMKRSSLAIIQFLASCGALDDEGEDEDFDDDDEWDEPLDEDDD